MQVLILASVPNKFSILMAVYILHRVQIEHMQVFMLVNTMVCANIWYLKYPTSIYIYLP